MWDLRLSYLDAPYRASRAKFATAHRFTTLSNFQRANTTKFPNRNQDDHHDIHKINKPLSGTPFLLSLAKGSTSSPFDHLAYSKNVLPLFVYAAHRKYPPIRSGQAHLLFNTPIAARTPYVSWSLGYRSRGAAICQWQQHGQICCWHKLRTER